MAELNDGPGDKFLPVPVSAEDQDRRVAGRPTFAGDAVDLCMAADRR